ncbi:23S rRNA (adenine(2030)-N(6))-methyltransferase RlmJ [Thalassobaculum sp. OXR-137]|uniref:23S rRNA (adenine(2030)-N(6))-methyltransferase RlmJ n=1 Tax=Thalassobaculum sp. OXR-137 TaxID=3100173 RepID=UPI002AC8F393|nr:23S rRNA (adenine(2030)-N(6))-methyltransferase RlmJ [Thalassobaculum sp. OXR-137]WPZ35893.1 23S rRNA (adenine(2030)-N(6))-methyltransferase RlmJ [Thalassobaculum sp. OXR-137]
MLSYQHGYHAGCLADVHKHAALAALCLRLREKPKPLSYLESHAGRAVYDLASPEAEKTGEAKAGILRLIAEGAVPPDHPLATAIRLTEQAYGTGFYPGSPMIAAQLLGPEDVLHLMELHPQEHAALKRAMRGRNVHIHRRDGYEGLLALSPPTPRRGLVLIDPSYEVKTEYLQVADVTVALHRKWPQATVMIWYPILAAGLHEPMAARLLAADLPAVLRREVRFHTAADTPGMRGSGLILVNAPWGVDAALDTAERMLGPALASPA